LLAVRVCVESVEQMLSEFGPRIYSADGPTVPFFGFPYPTRMAVVQLSEGRLWVWSPVALTDELVKEVEALGRVRYIVSPNKLHHLFLGEWAARWPAARLHAPPGLARRKPKLSFHAELDDLPDPAWAADIDQAIFRGSFVMEEVVFFHRASRTAIVGDLIQRHPESAASGLKGLVMRLDGLVGARGSAPREWRATFLQRRRARAARDKVLGWSAERLLIAHGDCVRSGAADVLAAALDWI
jgi:Domain of unknown function (DUF4336)